MVLFQYIGKNKKGAAVKGSIEAASEGEAIARLRFQGITIKEIWTGTKAPSSSASLFSGIFGNTKKKDTRKPLDKLKIKDAELAVFTKQLATLIDSGVAIVSAFDMLAQQTVNPTLRTIIEGIREQVENGVELDKAMSKYPQVFDSTYVSLVKAGAEAGQLDTMMKKIATYVEKNNKLKRQLKSAMAYPTFIIFVAILLTIGMLWFVVPMFTKQFEESGKELPGLTQFVVDASNFLKDNILYIVGGIVIIVSAFKSWSKTEKGKITIDKNLLKMPIFGILFTKIAVARFTGTMATLVSSGIALPEALKICAKAAGNKIIESEVYKVEDGVVKGKSMSEMMQKSPLFPMMVSGMIGIGEGTGKLDMMLEKVANIYEEEVDTTMAAVLKMVEPLMFVVIGGIVGFILIAMYLPIFDLASTQM